MQTGWGVGDGGVLGSNLDLAISYLWDPEQVAEPLYASVCLSLKWLWGDVHEIVFVGTLPTAQ